MLVLLIVIITLAVLLVLRSLWVLYKEIPLRKEEKRKLNERLADESIIDPETGTKLMVEQAVTGRWIYQGPVKRKYTEAEIETLPAAEQQELLRALNYIADSDQYKASNLRNEDIDFINSSRMFAKYNSWSHVDVFELVNRPGKLIIPTVCIRSHTAYQEDFEESQLLFWIYLEHDFGDYYLTEKTTAQKLARLLGASSGMVTKNYNVEILRESPALVRTLQLLNVFEGEKGLELDILDHNLLVKTTRSVNRQDLLKLEKLVEAHNF